jgi:hypothetical protein
MYSTCLFCHASLGANEVIERFPVGRRLAFDAAKGRLWVVCLACGRWNLTPLEERWEAVEDCERRFRGERVRAQTANIGFCRLPSSLELIRIGQPLGPEFAAWRYGAELRRRFRGAAIRVAAGASAAAVVGSALFYGLVSQDVTWPIVPMLGLWSGVGLLQYAVYRARNPLSSVIPSGDILRVPSGTDKPYAVFGQHLAETAVVPADTPDAWSLALVHARGRVVLSGDVARRALAVSLAHVNRTGGTRETVRDAVAAVGAARTTEYPALIATQYGGRHAHAARDIAAFKRVFALGDRRHPPEDPAGLTHLPAISRLALEMSLHEDSERRAMDGDLADLELAWREAEDIAAIADDMFTPASVTTWLATHRQAPDTRRR